MWGEPDPASGAPVPLPWPAPGLRRRVFPGEKRQLGLLRRWLASLFPPGPVRDDIAVTASELASNAICHTASGHGGWFAAEVSWSGPVVRAAVADGGAATEPRVIEDPDREHGRGLLVVQELSMTMGGCGDDRGRLIRADVCWDASPETAAAKPGGDEDAIRAGQAMPARRFAGVTAWFGLSNVGLVGAGQARV